MALTGLKVADELKHQYEALAKVAQLTLGDGDTEELQQRLALPEQEQS